MRFIGTTRNLLLLLVGQNCVQIMDISKSAVATVIVNEEHASGVAFREEAGLFERHRRPNPAAFTHDAHAPLRLAIVMRTAIQQHPSAALRTSLFR
jgi:hypothetical protein